MRMSSAWRPRPSPGWGLAELRQASGTPGVTTEVFTRLEDVRHLEPEWRDLAVTAGEPWGMPRWQWAWWRHAAPPGALLYVVGVYRDETVVGIAPLFIHSKYGVRWARVLGAGVSSRVGLLARPGQEETVAAAVAACLHGREPKPHAVLFEGVRSRPPWPRLLSDAWPSETRPRLLRSREREAPRLDLPYAEESEWLAAQSGHFRARMRRGLRKLADAGHEVRRVSDPDEVAVAVDDFARLHRLRWATRGGSGVLTESVVDLLLEAADRGNGDSPVDLWVVEGPEGRISVQVFLRAGEELNYWLGGFDPGYSSIRPGPAILTVFEVIRDCMASGIRRIDLGPGNQEYKAEFSDGSETLTWTSLCVSRPKAPMVRLVMAAQGIRPLLLARVPYTIKRRLRRWQEIRYRRS